MKYDIEKFNQLKSEGWLSSRKHEKYEFWVWKYTKQTQYSRFWNSITEACRSLVLDLEGNVVSPCIPKFYNLEEQKHTPTDKFKVYHKMDGQLVYIFIWNGELIIRSSSMFDSDVVENVRKLVLDVNDFTFQEGLTYCFELTGRIARIVVEYPYEAKLTLLTVFDNSNGEEIDITISGIDNVPIIICDDYNLLKQKDIDNMEGYIVKFDNGQRIKIKFDNYIRKHFHMNYVSTKSIWNLLLSGNLFEQISEFPDEAYIRVTTYALELSVEIESIRKRIAKHVQLLRTMHFENRKELYDFVMFNFPDFQILLSSYDGKDITEQIYNLVEPEFKILE